MAKRKTDLEGKTTVANKNANGEGTIYQIGSGPKKGQYICQITIGYDRKTKKQKKKSFYGKTKTEVKLKRDDYIEQHSLGLDLDTAQHTTFGEWLKQWLDMYKRPKLRLATYENYNINAITHIIPAIGDIYLTDLDTDNIQSFYNKLVDAGKAPATIQKIHQIVHGCLAKAVETHLLSWNPSQATERPSIKKSNGKAMSESDMDKFLVELNSQPDKWQAAFLTLLGTGLRIGELLALGWSDIDLDSGIININKTLSRTSQGLIVNDGAKTEASNAEVPIPDIALEAIKKHKIGQLAGALKKGSKFQNKTSDGHPIYAFASNAGTYISPRNFRRKFDALLDKAKCGHLTVHGLRHTFATRLLEQGENLKTVQELLRHADIKTTGNIYSHVSIKVKKKAAHKMDSLLRRNHHPS